MAKLWLQDLMMAPDSVRASACSWAKNSEMNGSRKFKIGLVEIFRGGGGNNALLLDNDIQLEKTTFLD